MWSQLGPKLVGSGAVGTQVSQGTAVAISSDGSTVIEGGIDDGPRTGAAWIFIRSALPGTPAPSTLLLTITGIVLLALFARAMNSYRFYSASNK
jgi:hypothetical protein